MAPDCGFATRISKVRELTDQVAEEDRVRREDAPPLAIQVHPTANEEVPGQDM